MKNKTKKEQKATFEIEKKIFAEIIKNNARFIARNDYILDGVQFEFDENLLRITSTDGGHLLTNEIIVKQGCGACEAVYSGDFLKKIRFFRSFLSPIGADYLKFTMTPKLLTIEDCANNITYNIPALSGKYPKWKQFFKTTKKCTQIGFNKAYLEEIKSMSVNCRTNIVKLTFKNNEAESPVIIESYNEDDEINSRMLIMPVRLFPIINER